MTNAEIRTAAWRYGVVGGAVSVVVLVGLALVLTFPLKLLGMVLLGVPLFLVPAIVGVTNEGIETAAASARIGRSTGNPQQYNPGNVLPIPNAMEVVCWLCGVGVGGLFVLIAVA